MDTSARLGDVVHLVDRALHTTLKERPADYVAAAEAVLFALRVTLEDAGCENPLAVMVAAVEQDRRASRT